MAKELKPCPFCGREAEVLAHIIYGHTKGYVARCKKGCCELKMYTSKQNAEKAWNRRAVNG